MKRRTVVKLIGTGSSALLVPKLVVSCTQEEPGALQPWKGPMLLKEEDDVRLKVLSFAILAPNAHNKQPWMLDVREPGIDLYIDPTRLLPETDPPARQIMISQGTFLETLKIAASHYGLEAKISLFPRGIDPLEHLGSHPVAHVELEKRDVQEDELFRFILQRHTNRRAYEGPSLNEGEKLALRRICNDEEYPLRVFDDSDSIKQIAGMMTEAMRIETSNRAMHAETVDMLRFTDEEVERHRDGISFPNLGITGVKLFFARMFTSRESAFDKSFLERTVETMRDGAFSARAIGLLTSRGLTRVDEVRVGMLFARIHLTATKLGLSLHPMSQVMEIDSVKETFLQEFQVKDQEPQMLFRLGRSAPTPHSPRRALQDFFTA